MRHKTQPESIVLTKPQRRVLAAAAKDPRGNAPVLDEGLWTRAETLEKLRDFGFMDNMRDLSNGERADKDQATINKMRATLSIMESGEWSAAHMALRELVDMTELRWAQVWRITAEGREWLAADRRRGS
jgi:hypothetical protein